MSRMITYLVKQVIFFRINGEENNQAPRVPTREAANDAEIVATRKAA